jgi:hypothetical protein
MNLTKGSSKPPLAQERNLHARGTQILVGVVLCQLLLSGQEYGFAFLIQDAEVHGSGVQVDSAIKFVLFGVYPPQAW